MEKLRFETSPGWERNIEKLQQLFPACVKESQVSGKTERTVDFQMLKLLLGEEDTAGSERYEFSWPGKKQALMDAYTSSSDTLRPQPERSRDWDTTGNLFIEGDNLTVLKLMQESYLGKIKMIYIDPPYNTGKDFIYKDNFAMSEEEYESGLGMYNSRGEKLFKNTESNGRFHSDWCSMIYSRLLLARNLLSEDGVIFISMDDNEQANLMKICDEIFGESNYIGQVIRKTKSMTADQGNGFNMQHEVLLIYGKNASRVRLHGEEKAFHNYANPDEDPNGDWCAGDPSARSGGPSTYFGIDNPYTHRTDYPPAGRYWAFSRTTMENYIQQGKIKFKKGYGESERGFVFKRYKKDAASQWEPVHSLFGTENPYMNQAATVELKELLGDSGFSYPKPAAFIEKLVQYATGGEDLVLDFFAGSGTTAQAVMEANARDGGKRKFILVQLPEKIQNKEYDNLCQLSQERIRRCGDRLRQEGKTADTGFRVFSVGDSNWKDVYCRPEDYHQEMLALLESNIKEDRSDLDLLFGCLLEWGYPLSMTYTAEEIEGCRVYTCGQGELAVCFAQKIPESVIRKIAAGQPRCAVFRDSGFAGSSERINVGEIFRLLAPGAKVKVI